MKMNSRQVHQGVLLFMCLALLFVSDVSAKNPFSSFLPEKPKKQEEPPAGQAKKPTTPEIIEPPKVEVKIEPPVLILNGLIWNSANPQAIIDGKIVRVGDAVREVKINKITRDGVEGDFKGIKVHLKP